MTAPTTMQSEAMLRSGAHDSGAQMIPGFGHDTWWLIVAKALAVFVFLVLTVLVAILAERKILGRMQTRAELYELLGYHDWEARDRSYFGEGGPFE